MKYLTKDGLELLICIKRFISFLIKVYISSVAIHLIVLSLLGVQLFGVYYYKMVFIISISIGIIAAYCISKGKHFSQNTYVEHPGVYLVITLLIAFSYHYLICHIISKYLVYFLIFLSNNDRLFSTQDFGVAFGCVDSPIVFGLVLTYVVYIFSIRIKQKLIVG